MPKLGTTPLRTDLKIRISRLLEMSARVYRKLIKVGRGGEGAESRQIGWAASGGPMHIIDDKSIAEIWSREVA